MHGGSAPAARARARLRLLELADPAIATLAREMVQADRSVDRQKAANSILDRAGYGRVTRMESADARELLIARLLELRAEARERGDVLDVDLSRLDLDDLDPDDLPEE